MKKTQITIDIELDENNVPEKMTWNAEDGGIEKEETKATIRCIPLDAEEEHGVSLITGKPSSKRVLFAKAY